MQEHIKSIQKLNPKKEARLLELKLKDHEHNFFKEYFYSGGVLEVFGEIMIQQPWLIHVVFDKLYQKTSKNSLEREINKVLGNKEGGDDDIYDYLPPLDEDEEKSGTDNALSNLLYTFDEAEKEKKQEEQRRAVAERIGTYDAAVIEREMVEIDRKKRAEIEELLGKISKLFGIDVAQMVKRDRDEQRKFISKICAVTGNNEKLTKILEAYKDFIIAEGKAVKARMVPAENGEQEGMPPLGTPASRLQDGLHMFSREAAGIWASKDAKERLQEGLRIGIPLAQMKIKEEKHGTMLDVIKYYTEGYVLRHDGIFDSFVEFQKKCSEFGIKNTTIDDYLEVYLKVFPKLDSHAIKSRVFNGIPTELFINKEEMLKTLKKIVGMFSKELSLEMDPETKGIEELSQVVYEVSYTFCRLFLENDGNIKERFRPYFDSLKSLKCASDIGVTQAISGILTDKNKMLWEKRGEIGVALNFIAGFLLKLRDEFEAISNKALKNFLEQFAIWPITSGAENLVAELNDLLRNAADISTLSAFVKKKFMNGSDLIPRDMRKSYNQIAGNEFPHFISGLPSLALIEKMFDDVISADKLADNKTFHLHILSVLDENLDQEKIRNVKAACAFFLATYKYPNITLKITNTILSMRDHMMREENGELLSFKKVDKCFDDYRGSSSDSENNLYAVHCKSGWGRSPAIAVCEGVRFDGYFPSEAYANILKSRPGVHALQNNKTRPDQLCFIYAYFFDKAAQSLADKNSGFAKKFDSNIANKNFDSIVGEIKWALGIDYKHNLYDPKHANVLQWKKQLTQSFVEFNSKFSEKFGVDLFEQLLIDYVHNYKKYSSIQRNNLLSFFYKYVEGKNKLLGVRDERQYQRKYGQLCQLIADPGKFFNSLPFTTFPGFGLDKAIFIEAVRKVRRRFTFWGLRKLFSTEKMNYIKMFLQRFPIGGKEQQEIMGAFTGDKEVYQFLKREIDAKTNALPKPIVAAASSEEKSTKKDGAVSVIVVKEPSEKTALLKDDKSSYDAIQTEIAKSPSGRDIAVEGNNQGIRDKQLGWNCFDIAIDFAERLGISEKNSEQRAALVRAALVKFALANADNLEFRQALVPEIRSAAMATWAPPDVGSLDIEKLPENMRKSEFLEKASACWRDAGDAKASADLDAYCATKAVYEQYVREHYGNKGWFNAAAVLGQQSMTSIVATMLQIEIVVRVKNNTQIPASVSPIRVEAPIVFDADNAKSALEKLGKTAHVLYNGVNHFIKDSDNIVDEKKNYLDDNKIVHKNAVTVF